MPKDSPGNFAMKFILKNPRCYLGKAYYHGIKLKVNNSMLFSLYFACAAWCFKKVQCLEPNNVFFLSKHWLHCKNNLHLTKKINNLQLTKNKIKISALPNNFCNKDCKDKSKLGSSKICMRKQNVYIQIRYRNAHIKFWKHFF